jgi:hypothetical protein
VTPAFFAHHTIEGRVVRAASRPMPSVIKRSEI